MLTHLSIRDVVLIERLDLEFQSGLTALTGETGAGKSIVLDALGLALGARADAGLIRPGADKLSVAASFVLPAGHPVGGLLAEQDIATDDGAIVLRRVVGIDGRGRAFINDQAVGAALLRTVGERLVEVHGQLDTHGLLDTATHLDVLDQFRIARDGRGDDAACAAAYARWREAEAAFAQAKSELERALAEEERLRAALAELQALSPAVGEEQALADKRAVLKQSEHIAKALDDARQALTGENDAEAALRTALGKVSRMADRAAGTLDAARQALERAVIETAEAIGELERAADALDASPDALERAEERLFALKAAARKHRCAVDELPGLTERIARQLDAIDAGGAQVNALGQAAQAAAQDYARAAKALHAARIAAAARLDKAMAKELPPLKLDRAVFKTAVAEVAANDGGARGVSRVTFEVATNPGAAPGPLNKIASGGELARFMLALRVVLAGSQGPTTMIFDEVDAGISGATANAVGLRLAKLAGAVQVLVVTHAPQVAARAQHHWRVAKATRGGVAATTVDTLSAASRREEIARMLAGAKVTDEARAAAESLLAGTPS